MQPSTTTAQYRSPKTVLLIVAGLVLLGLWYGFAKSAAPPATNPSSQIVGQQRHLVSPGEQTLTLFASNDDLDNGIRALSVGDSDHAIQIARRGYVVPAGASVIILATSTAGGYPSAQVRILEGSSALRTGWVTMDKLSP